MEAGGGIACDDCPGLCCAVWEMHVTSEDVERLQVAGHGAAVTAVATHDNYAGRMRRSLQVIGGEVVSACAQLTGARCGVYDSRPRVCRDFEPGGERCNRLRTAAGLEI